jgi:zinc and cadmium transporter
MRIGYRLGMVSYPLLTAYCLLIALAALSGGWTTLMVKLTHQRLQLATSVIGGFMLGVALLHLLPHAMISAPAASGGVGYWMLGGMLMMFLLERFVHFHHHEVIEVEHDPAAGHDEVCEPQPAHDHLHHELHNHVHVHQHRMSWTGALVGLVIHSLIGGAALGAAMAAEGSGRFAGLAVFLISFLHKPLDSMTLLTLMRVAGCGPVLRHSINVGYSLVVPAGAVLFLLGIGGGDAEHSAVIGAALAVAAGVFLSIALSDLLPELQFHAHDRVKLTVALLLGVALAWSVSLFESQAHEHPRNHEMGHVERHHESHSHEH